MGYWVETIVPQTAADYGYMASGSRVYECGHGLRPMLNAGPCLWHKA